MGLSGTMAGGLFLADLSAEEKEKEEEKEEKKGGVRRVKLRTPVGGREKSCSYEVSSSSGKRLTCAL